MTLAKHFARWSGKLLKLCDPSLTHRSSQGGHQSNTQTPPASDLEGESARSSMALEKPRTIVQHSRKECAMNYTTPDEEDFVIEHSKVMHTPSGAWFT